jgi:glycerol kinase
MAENVPEIAAAKEDGTLMIGTVDSWLLYVSFFSFTNQLRTSLTSIMTSDWNRT